MSDYWLLDGWYLRLKTVELSYGLPERVLPKFMDDCRFYATAYNLITWDAFRKKYNQDPEISTNTAGDAYMNQRVIQFGVMVTF